ncbi:hypothetical protein [Sinorhizobium fredii]|uniref:hypothetical protein n=1 Tax=Rhizobium fredii TaxID=380 RepID=UPI0012FE3805|nr:hypothetical protein [Sinorhizobium fredii]
MFSKGFFIVSQFYPSYDGRNKKSYRMLFTHGYWLLHRDHNHVGEIFVFEQRDAAKRLYDFKVTTGERYGSKTSLRFHRAMTQKGAAAAVADGHGELLEYFSPTYQEAEEFARIAAERREQAYRDDVATYRALIEKAHERFPKMDRSAIPQPNEDNPHTEAIYLGHYAISLFRCGAISADEIDRAQKSSKNGFSDYRYAEDRYELVMVPN